MPSTTQKHTKTTAKQASHHTQTPEKHRALTESVAPPSRSNMATFLFGSKCWAAPTTGPIHKADKISKVSQHTNVAPLFMVCCLFNAIKRSSEWKATK